MLSTENLRITAPRHDGYEAIECRAKRRIRGGQLSYRCKHLLQIGSVNRAAQWLFVVAIWGFQLIFSSWWLTRFRYGPLEWLWRSLTYGRLQPR